MDMKRLGITIAVLILLALMGAAGWYFGSPLLLDQRVNEALPFTLPTPTEVTAQKEVGIILPPTAASSELTPTVEVSLLPTITPEFVIEEDPIEDVIEATATAEPVAQAPANSPLVIGQGQFVDGDTFHKGSGTATLFQGPDSTYLLRLDDLVVTNGPDLHVLLSTNPTPTDHANLGTYLDLGSLKGNIGDQNYTLPTGIDGTQYKSVIIYCLPFQIIFATATLQE
jgi:hypothetical protein